MFNNKKRFFLEVVCLEVHINEQKEIVYNIFIIEILWDSVIVC